MIARDHRHNPLGNTGAELRRRNIIERDGNMHDLTRSVILAAAEGVFMELKLVNPIVNAA
jgi:hypothetical protein